MSTNLPILVSKITNEITKILLPLDEQDHMPNHGEINIQIHKKLVNMGLCEDITFEFFLLDFKIDEETCWHILGLWYIIQKSTYFLKRKPNDICTNVFGIHVGPLWGENKNARYILDPYVAILYYTSYLTKINNFVPQKMKIILDKYKHDEQTKCVKKF